MGVLRLIAGERFDLAILFQNAIEAAIMAKLAGIRMRAGYNTDARRNSSHSWNSSNQRGPQAAPHAILLEYAHQFGNSFVGQDFAFSVPMKKSAGRKVCWVRGSGWR